MTISLRRGGRFGRSLQEGLGRSRRKGMFQVSLLFEPFLEGTPVVNLKFSEDIGDVEFHRAFADIQGGRNFLIGEPSEE